MKVTETEDVTTAEEEEVEMDRWMDRASER